jgi:hypothetical protein
MLWGCWEENRMLDGKQALVSLMVSDQTGQMKNSSVKLLRKTALISL